MTLLEIKTEMDDLNEKLAEAIHKAYFTLNEETKEIYERIDELQAECTHEFDDGVCVYCSKIREEMPEDAK